MFSRIFTAAVLVAAASSAAIASDLPARAVTKAVPYVQSYNWTGLYAGVNVGYAWARPTVDDFGTATNLNGVIGGAQIGYNWQAGHLVFGLETDFQGSSQNASQTMTIGFPITVSERIRYFGTVRGRLGYAQDRWLAYVTGGYAYTNFGVDGTQLGVAFSSKDTGSGYTLGSGLEYAFAQNWSGKLEYLFMDTATRNVVTANFMTDNLRYRNNIVRVGLNYKFW